MELSNKLSFYKRSDDGGEIVFFVSFSFCDFEDDSNKEGKNI